MSADDDLASIAVRLASLCRGEDRGHQVGKALADPGSGLDDQMPLRLDGPGDRVSHRQLLLAAFVARHAFGDQSPFAEDIFGEERLGSVTHSGESRSGTDRHALHRRR